MKTENGKIVLILILIIFAAIVAHTAGPVILQKSLSALPPRFNSAELAMEQLRNRRVSPFVYANFDTREVHLIAASSDKKADLSESSRLLGERLRMVALRAANLPRAVLGIPCSRCHGGTHKILYDDVLGGNAGNSVPASCLLRNTFSQEARDTMMQVGRSRLVYVVMQSSANASSLRSMWPNTKIWRICVKDGDDAIMEPDDTIHDLVNSFESGATVVLCCGPSGTVWAVEWFEQRPDISFVSAGSLFDDLLYKASSQALVFCPECNPLPLVDTSFTL